MQASGCEVNQVSGLCTVCSTYPLRNRQAKHIKQMHRTCKSAKLQKVHTHTVRNKIDILQYHLLNYFPPTIYHFLLVWTFGAKNDRENSRKKKPIQGNLERAASKSYRSENPPINSLNTRIIYLLQFSQQIYALNHQPQCTLQISRLVLIVVLTASWIQELLEDSTLNQ